MNVKALGETPTRPENAETALAPHAKGPLDRLEKPFTWTRRLLSVRAPTIEGMNYLVKPVVVVTEASRFRTEKSRKDATVADGQAEARTGFRA